MIIQFVIHIIGNGGFAFDLKTSGRPRAMHVRSFLDPSLLLFGILKLYSIFDK
jgi:hypothetical protein